VHRQVETLRARSILAGAIASVASDDIGGALVRMCRRARSAIPRMEDEKNSQGFTAHEMNPVEAPCYQHSPTSILFVFAASHPANDVQIASHC
jgi:hypothetical protein